MPNSRHPTNPRHKESSRFWTIPNALCLCRVAGSPFLILLSVNERPLYYLWLYLFLALTDWLDGKLAILLKQRSVYGARLDTWADAAMYLSLAVGAIILWEETIVQELLWLLPALVTYACTISYALWKFRRWPSYHTRMAKTSWLLLLVGVIAFVCGYSLWPLRISLLAITLTNAETILLTWRLTEWKADVPSVFCLKNR